MVKCVKKFQVALLLSLLILACTKDEKQVVEVERVVEIEIEKQVIKNVPNQSPVVVAVSDIQSKGVAMFTDADEQIVNGSKILYNQEMRSFRVHQMLEIKAVGQNTCRIRNFLPYTFRNLEILATAQGLKAPVKIVEIPEFPPLYEYTFELPFSQDEIFFLDVEGNQVSLQNFANISPSQIQLSFEGNDPMLSKMKTIKLRTLYYFKEYKQPGKWGDLTIQDARNYLPVIMNMAYMFSSDEFEKRIYDTPYEFENQRGVPLERERVVKSFRSPQRQELGIVIQPGLGGLAGGATFGVRPEYLSNPDSGFYKKSDWKNLSAPRSIVLNHWIHEFGHAAGYGHDGNMTYFYSENGENKGLVPVGLVLYQEMLLNKELPFTEYPY